MAKGDQDFDSWFGVPQTKCFPPHTLNFLRVRSIYRESESVTDIVEGKVGNLASGDAGSEVGDVPNQPDLVAIDLHHLLGRFKL